MTSDQLSVVAGLVFACSACLTGAQTFDEQRKAVSISPATQPEAAILSLLKAGLDEGQAVPAIAEAQKWLRQNVPEDPMLLYHAGRAAEWSGDWKNAVALYQQYLDKADLKSATADEAVYAVYTLLIERLKDVEGAYSFSRTEGDRLMVCARARQFDAWFLDQAISRHRQDVLAVARRLNAGMKAGLPNDLVIAHYDQYYRWLLQQAEGMPTRDLQVTREIFDAYKSLVSVMSFDEELKLSLDWAISVRFYIQQRLAEQDVAPPVAEAGALLAKYPNYALRVQLGWVGGAKDNHPHHAGDYKYYWAQELDAKMAPVVAAATRLSPLQRAELLASWRPGYYHRQAQKPGLLELKAVRDYLLSNPKLMNSRSGLVVLDKPWKELTPEEAMKLAPQLQQNASLTAALIRAKAAGGKEQDYGKIAAAYLGAESWRFPQHHDQRNALWFGRDGLGGFGAGTPEQKAAVEKMKAALGGGLQTLDAKKEAPAAQRIAAFRKLWKDYTSPQPKITSVRERLWKVLLITPEAIPELLKDSSPEAQMLARDALVKGMTGPEPLWKETVPQVNVKAYGNIINELARRHTRSNVQDLKTRYPGKFHPHPLEGALRASLVNSLKQNKLVAWQVMAWINMQLPEGNAEQVKLMQAMHASPAWQTMPFEVRFSAREWFGKDALTSGQLAWIDAADPEIVCRDLHSITNTTDVAATAAALNKVIEGVKVSPVKINLQGLEKLALVTNTVFTDSKVFDRILEITDGLRVSCDRASEPFAARLQAHVIEQSEPQLVHRTAAYLWSFGLSEHYARSLPKTMELAQSFLVEQPATARALARVGLGFFSHQVPEHPRNWADRNGGRASLKSLAGKAAMKLGLMVIPVPKGDPAYPVYQSQGDWLTGNEDSAWDLLDEHWEQLLPVHRDLSFEYLTWALQRVIYARDDLRQEELVKALLAWAREENSPLSLTQKIELELAYGDIAVQRGMLPEAHKLFTSTAKNEAYEGMLLRHQATLRRARVERFAKDFDGALKTLGELEMERIPGMWSEVRYARAEVYFDMEEFGDAADEIETILTREPRHADAKIMLGKVQLKRQKLMDATIVELGSSTEQPTLVPGEKLKVTLDDPTLEVSGTGTEVEVLVWAKSGDKEAFFLQRFGDQKTKFRGEVATALGAPAPNDRVLQVIGDDEVFYAYTEAFRKKMNNLPEMRGGPITVASDALLMASARKLLSAEEQRIADMEKQMAELKRKNVRNVEAALRAARAAEAEENLLTVEASEPKVPVETRAKPGKPIHVRVIDPDRSRSEAIDELAVSVSTSSGDAIGRVVLKETGTHTGWFEGQVPTASAQAQAFAENTESGRNPNMVISPKADYPAWRPVAVKNKTPSFRVDLNDNVALGELTITAKEAGSALKNFVLQTGMSPRDITTVGVYPRNLVSLKQPWHPSVVVMTDTDHHHTRDERSVYELGELNDHLERGWTSQEFAAGVAENVAGPSEAMNAEIPGKVTWKRQNRHHNAHVVYRFRGYFHEPAEVTRRFKVELGNYKVPEKTHPSVAHPPQFLLAVDGRPITDPEKMNRLEGEVTLRPGLHRFEIWATGWDCTIGFGRSIKLLANLEDPERLAECPDAFFDPSTFPEGLLPHRNATATITANEDGTEFKVAFASGSRTRMLNLLFLDQEGTVPALNKLTLNDAAGEPVLPVPEDFATLNKNNTLEILTGDKVAVRYVDDRPVTASKEKLERFLNVAYSDAKVRFEFFEMRRGRDGEMAPYYEERYRFKHGEQVHLSVNDPDMDLSVEPDTVSVVLESPAGKQTVTAVEDGDSTGIFRFAITPVTGAPTKEGEIQVGAGEQLTASYRDAENNRPGVPIDRTHAIAHAEFSVPVLKLSHAVVGPFVPTEERSSVVRGLSLGFTPMSEQLHEAMFKDDRRALRALRASQGQVRARYAYSPVMKPATTPPEGGFAAVHGRRLHLEVEAPQLALRSGSRVDVFVQTRAKASHSGGQADAFDIDLPGTLKLVAGFVPGQGAQGGDPWRLTPQIPIYQAGHLQHEKGRENARFFCTVPLIPGVLPDHGILTREEIDARRKEGLYQSPSGLVVKPGERVHIGFRYTDDSGAPQWVTASTRVITHPVLDVMEADYRTEKKTAYVGETLYLRVVDLGADVSDKSDKVSVLLQAKSGAKHQVELHETDPHSGVFRAGYALTFTGAVTNAAVHSIRRDGFPVTYGDMVGLRYTDAQGQKTDTHLLSISKGADGTIEPFSKQYDDPEIAMRTQFSLAESYLELAKRHRALGETEVAAREYARAKQLPANAMLQFRDPETRAHAEYLLGNLTQEEADATTDPDLKESRYRAALSRFMTVTGSYPNTLHASKAQFKIATVYEKLKEPDIAAQEYVKLAYKYPDSEFLALSMARLGTHFLRKATAYEKKAAPLLEKTEDLDAQHDGQAMQAMAVREYLKAAQIFRRLLDRFPDHELAGKGGLRAGQAYMRADQNRWALEVFRKIYENESYDGKELRSQAMYWAGMCYQTTRQEMAAYSIFKRLTYDFPESTWASYARGQLSQESLLRLETKLEIERLEEEGQ